MSPRRRKTGPSGTTALLVIRRAQGFCERCPRIGEQIHHRRPRGMGGTRQPWINGAANLVYLCFWCHADIESQRARAERDGWLLTGMHLAIDVPVQHARLGRVLLDDKGGHQPAPAKEAA